MKLRETATRWMTLSGVGANRQLVDMEEKADMISLGVVSNTSASERSCLTQMGEDSRRLTTMLTWPLDELIREVQCNPNVVNCADSTGATLLHYAAKKDREDVIEFLVDNGGVIDAKDIDDNTPAHWAILCDQQGALKCLLEAGADSGILNMAQMALIHVACDLDKPEMIEILASQKDFDPNLVGDLGQTPIHFCAAKDCERAAKKILEYKPKLCQCDISGIFPLHCAATHASKRVLDLLLTEGEKYGYTRAILFSFKDKEVNTPLHSAVNGGSEEAVKVCLVAGAPPDVQQDDNLTPLHLACSQGALGIVKLLLQADYGLKTLHMPDIVNMTPLHKAAMFDHVQVVEYLLDMGADIDTIDKHLRTPLLLATSRGAWRTASLLIQHGANHSLKDDEHRNIIHLMVLSGGNLNIIGMEIPQKDAVFTLINDTDNRGCTPMHYATRDGNIKSVQGLLEMGATVKLKNKDKQSPLHFAAKYGRFNSCKRLLDSDIGPNIINDTDYKGMTPLHIASWSGQTRVIQLLMLRGALLHRDHEGRTPLHLAAMAGHVETMKVLTSTHAHLLDQTDAKGDSALNIAARAGQVKSVNYLLTAGASLLFNRHQQGVISTVIEEKREDVASAMVMHDRWHEILQSYKGPDCPVGKLIEYMPQVMKKVLDRSVTFSTHDSASVDFWVNYDFRYLEPPIDMRVQAKKHGTPMQPLPALNHMVRNNMVDLISHPLCIEYLNSKWVSYGGPIHYSYMTLYLIFLAFLTYFISSFDPTPRVIDDGTISHRNITGEPQVIGVSEYFAVSYILLYAILNIVKEFIQMFQQRWRYFTEIENFPEWTLYVCTLLFVLPFCLDTPSHLQWGSGAIAIFFAWFNLLLYQQRIDTIGIYVVMFYHILKTIVAVMVVFSVIIIAFGFAFYILMSGELNHAFSSPEISILRVFTMMMAELDFINSFVKPLTDDDPATLHYEKLSYFFLVAVIILLPILLMNLLIGLAVGDIAAIQRDAQLKRLAMQVELHSDFEPKLPATILQWVSKDNITLRPNGLCPTNMVFKWMQKIKSKAIVRDGGKKRFASLVDLQLSERDKMCFGEIEQSKQKLKIMSSKIDKQYQLLKLIVHKLDIHSDADDQDEGEAPPGDDCVRLRLHMSTVVKAAISSFPASKLRVDTATTNLTPNSGSPISDVAWITEPSI